MENIQENDFVEVSPPTSPRIWKPIPHSPGSYSLADIRCCYCGRMIEITAEQVKDINSLVCHYCAAECDKTQRKITEFLQPLCPTS